MVAPSRHIPLIGAPTKISYLINFLVMEMTSRHGDDLKMRQEKLPQSYWENDVLVSMKNWNQEEGD